MSDASLFDRFVVVLVEPGDSRNVGAAARAMQNLGFARLRLVSPKDFDREQAGVTARNASSILDALEIFDDLDAAIADVQEVVGLALRTGQNPAHYVSLPDWASGLAGRPGKTVALVFGPESDDLRREHLEKCRWIVRIPSSAAFPSFNLAQSVLLALYEITRSLPESLEPGSAPPIFDAPTQNDYAQLTRLVDSVMAQSGFVRPGTPAASAEVVHSLLRRLDADRRELGVLTALFSRIENRFNRERI